MKLMIASYNNGGATWNAEVEETQLRSYSLEHRFNEPARCVIELNDPTGTLIQKYNADANDVYIGVAKLTLEDPTGTDIFEGRIAKAIGNSADRTVVLECFDWLCQLDDEKITYDMREKLSGNIRQSTLHTDDDISKVYKKEAATRNLKSAQADDGGAQTDETDEANEDTADDMTLLPAVPAVNDAYYFGFNGKTSSFWLNITQQGAWSGTTAWEYSQGAGSWNALVITGGWDDGWQDTFEDNGWLEYTHTPQGDWATDAVNGVTAYWIRCRVATYVGITTQPLGGEAYAEYYVYDDTMAWANDAYNGLKLFFTAGMAGNIEVSTGPYQEQMSIVLDTTDAPAAGTANVWEDDGSVHEMEDSGSPWNVRYDFRSRVTASGFYTSMSKASVEIVACNEDLTAPATVEVDSGGTYYEIGFIEQTAADEFLRKDLRIPDSLLSNIWDAAGEASVRVNAPSLGNLKIDMIRLKCTVLTTGYSTGVTINDTINPNLLEVATDLTAAATKVWEGIPYCIAKPIHDHLESATGPILGGDATVTLTAAGGDIEDTTGYSTSQFKDVSRLQILKTLAEQDQSVFWITLGGTTVTYKQTFGADTQQLTDGKIKSWRSQFDYGPVYNSYKVYGIRIGDYEVYQLSEDAASKTKYLSTKTKVIHDTGLVSDVDASSVGTALVAKQHEAEQMVGCTIAGNTATAAHGTTIRLGEIVEITSSYLWPTAAKDYIVSRFVYDSKRHETDLTLYPKASLGEKVVRPIDPTLKERNDRRDANIYTPDPITHEVA
jgi:hypothetical protein